MMPAVRTGQEKSRTDHAKRSNGERKISNGVMPAVQTANENFARMTPAVRTANKKFPTDDANHSNGWREFRTDDASHSDS